jgi:hypothetical protein
MGCIIGCPIWSCVVVVHDEKENKTTAEEASEE